MSDQLKWNLKDSHGRIFGPLDTQSIIELISKGVLSGEELISRFSEERWTILSKYPEFYEAIVEAINKPQTKFTADEFANEVSRTIKKSAEKTESNKTIQKQEGVKKRGHVIVEEETDASHPTNSKPFVAEETKVTKLNDQKLSKTENLSHPEPTITLKNLSSDDNRKKKIFYFLAGLALIFITLTLLESFQNSSKIPSGRIQLLFPADGGGTMSAEEQRQMLQAALKNFEQDNYEQYYQSHVQIVRVLESNKKNLDALSLLCLTYRELWEYAKQDSKDLQNLTRLVQLAQSEDSLGIHGTTCRLVQAMMVGDVKAQDSMVQSALTEFPTGAVFYEMKAEVLKQQKQESTAIAFLQKAQGLWKNWTKPYIKEAQYRVDLKDFTGAEIILKNVLEKNPKNYKAMALLGILEIMAFGKTAAGTDKILIALKETGLPRDLQVESYTTLAQSSIATDSAKALEYAKKAYELNPANSSMRSLILQLGGEGELAAVRSEDSQLILLGDSYLRNKNYLAAQAQYKAAFDLNSKNASAALKASESLWNLNQSEEAIEWAKKAIKADAKLLEAYYKLSEYYSQKYDFKAAGDILTAARGQAKPNYQLFRSYARLELKKRNSANAKKFAEQALKLYDSDSESLNILSEALRLEGNYEGAFKHAAKSVQIDAQNPNSHEAYGLALLGYRGLLVAQEYMTNLMNTYPDNTDYKTSYAQILYTDERYQSAIDNLNRVVQTEPSKYRAWMLLGDSYLKINDLNEALKSYFKAAALDPSNSEPMFHVGKAYMRSKPNLSRALKQFQNVIQTNPRYPQAHYYAGQVAFEMGLVPQALDYVEKEKKQNPNLADPYILSAEIHTKQQNYTKAANELRRAVQLRPNDSNLYIMLARNHRLSGQLDAATSMLRVAMAKESGNAEIYKEQGAVFEKMGLSEQALAAYSRYIEIKPNAEDRSSVEERIRRLGGG